MICKFSIDPTAGLSGKSELAGTSPRNDGSLVAL
jgi:hypothetical protein